MNDNEKQFNTARDIIESRFLFLPFEVVAEIVYVLEKLYETPRKEIKKAIELLIDYDNITTTDFAVLTKAIEIYVKDNLDFVDGLLVAYSHVHQYKVYTFDKKLSKKLLI